MIQPSTVPKGGTASDRGPATITSQGLLGSMDVSGQSGAQSLLPNPVTPVNDEDTNPSLQYRKTASLARTGQRPNAAVVPGVLSGLATAGMAAATSRNSDPFIPVPDAETLGKIGHDPDYPPNGNYEQTGYIDGSQLRESIGSDTHPFTGTLRGKKGSTIANLKNCLVKNLGRRGQVENLHLTNARISSPGPTAVVACKISDQATVSNICVDNARVEALGRYAYGGIAGGDVSGTVANIRAKNCSVTASGNWISNRAGIGAGKLKSGGKVANITAVNCKVSASDLEGLGGVAGIGAGLVSSCRVKPGKIVNITAVNCQVETSDGGYSGIGAGILNGGTLENTTAMNCTVSARDGYPGIGAGVVGCGGSITNTTAVNCRVENSAVKFHNYAAARSAGIGAGWADGFGTVAGTTTVNSTVNVSGETAIAGIGVGNAFGYGTVVDTTAVNCTVTALGKGVMAGIGAGQVSVHHHDKDGPSAVKNTLAVNCNVTTSGEDGRAGIGVGQIRNSNETIADTLALNCTVRASGKNATADIGAGGADPGSNVVNTTAINCEVYGPGEYPTASVQPGNSTDICNIRKDGLPKNITLDGCRSWLDNLCEGIDRRLLKSDCQFHFGHDDFVALIKNNTRRSELCAPAVIPSATSKSGPTMPGLSNASLAPTMRGLGNASIAGIPTTHGPGKSGDSAGLTSAAITGIALGGVLFLLIGVGYCIYRYCCHRASPGTAGRYPLGQSRGESYPEGGSDDDLQRCPTSLDDPAEGDNQQVRLISEDHCEDHVLARMFHKRFNSSNV